MTEKNKKFGDFKTAYVCSRTGEGIAVEVGQEPSPGQIAAAHATMITCEVEAECPHNCAIRELIEEVRKKGSGGLLF